MPKPNSTLLIINNSPGGSDYVHQFQQEEAVNYNFLTEPFGTHALELCRSHPIDSILLKLDPPYSHSLGFLRQLKEQMGANCPPIVAVGSGDAEIAVQAFKNGATDYLIEGRMTPDDLRMTMRGAIENTQLKQELQRSQKRFQVSVENMLDCFGIFSSIRNQSGQILDFRIDYLNTAACENNQMPRERQIGRGLCEVLPGHRESGLFGEYCRLVETGQPLIKESLIYEDVYGERQLVRAFDIRASRLNDGFVASWRDVTDRKRLELELNQTTTTLRASEQQYRELAEAMPQMVWTADARGAVSYWNQRWYEYTRLSEAESLGLAGVRTVHPDDRDRTLKLWEESVSQAVPFEVEYRIQRWDGIYHWFICRGIPTRDDQGQATGWIGTITDIDDRKRVEAHLHQQIQEAEAGRQILDALMEYIPEGITIADAPDVMIRKVSRYGQQLTGRSAETLVNISADEHPQVWNVFYADGVTPATPEVLPLTRAVRQGEVVTDEEWVLQKPDGQKMVVLCNAAPIYNSSGEIVKGIVAWRDITERKRTETILQRSQEQLTLAMAAARMGSWEWDIQTNEVRWSANLERLFGLTPGSFDGSYQAVREMIHPEDIGWVEQAIHRAVYERADYNIEFRFIKPDGMVRWATGLGQVIYDEAGNPLKMAGIDMDITQRKETEATLAANEARYRCLAELIPQLVWTANGEGLLLDVNQRWADYTGLTLEQVTAVGWQAVVHPEDMPVLAQEWSEAVRHGTTYQAEGRMRRADGVFRWHLHQAIPQRNEQGDIVKWFGTATDIEMQKQFEAERDRLLREEQAAREAAERANRIKDEFLAILSHELRSPLNPILGWTKLLQTRKFDAIKTSEALATIERNARLQTQLIDDLLDVAKILRGKLSMEMAPVDLVFVIEGAIDTVRSTAIAKNIALQTVLPSIGQVFGDAARLQQIVWNLLSNAVKFTPAGGRVEVRLERVEGGQWRVDRQADPPSPIHPFLSPTYTQITVRDTGKGIKPEFLPHIFESFRQEDTSTTRKFGGLGLGLAIVRHLVEAHGGMIWADSPGEEEGSTFTVRLPLLQVENAQRQSEKLPQQEPDLTGVRILTVDDEPDARELLTILLSQYGAEVFAVASTAEVLANLDSFQPNVLVCDIGMPDMDGYFLIQQVRNLPPERGGGVPAIALTAYARGEDSQKALDSGYQMHVTKPLDADQLVRTVLALVSNSRPSGKVL
jgi:PAS domain S-box-containing protein